MMQEVRGTSNIISTVEELDGAVSRHLRTAGCVVPRQSVHTLYGGADLYNALTSQKMGRLALAALDKYAPDAGTFCQITGIPGLLSETVYQRVREKLALEPVEDLRIDFEDGYGLRTDTEEDSHASAAAAELASVIRADAATPFCGIRIKPFTTESRARAIRTLTLFLTDLIGRAGRLPHNFIVTLPKVSSPEQAARLDVELSRLEQKLGLDNDSVRTEIMVETPQSIIAADGRFNLPLIREASGRRLFGAHFGAYDYTSSVGITSAGQDLLHPACDFVRNMMLAAFAGTGVNLSDGATNRMPIGPHRNARPDTAEWEANFFAVADAWRLHFEHVMHSLNNGFYQGWDLHPAQLPTRFAAVYTYFLDGMDEAAERLRSFIAKAARATLVGSMFDDAATGQGLLLHFARAVNCGAITEAEANDLTGLTIAQLASGSFADIAAA